MAPFKVTRMWMWAGSIALFALMAVTILPRVLKLSRVGQSERIKFDAEESSTVIVGSDVPSAERVPAQSQIPGQNTMNAALGVSSKTLVDRFRNSSNCVTRLQIVKELALSEFPETGQLIQTAILADYRGLSLSINEERALLEMVLILGLAAKTSNDSYTFLQKGTDPSFWQSQSLWKSPFAGYLTNHLAICSIQGIGLSGRTDALEILIRLRDELPDQLRKVRFSGAITAAAFYRDMVNQHGHAFWFSNVLRTERESGFYLNWGQTDTGSKWKAWNYNIHGIDPVKLQAPSDGPIPQP